jgi:hypothetical protein
MISVPLWLAAAVFLSYGALACLVGVQRRVIERGSEARRELSLMIQEYEQLIGRAQQNAMASQRGADQLALLVRIMEWRRENGFEDFNELVMWELAEDLQIDRQLASDLYDRIVKRDSD